MTLVENILLRLRDALSRGDQAEAERLAIEILESQPDHEPTLAYLANTARLRGDLAAARRWAERGLQQLPNSAILHFNLGAVFDMEGQTLQAREQLQTAIEIQPEFAMAHLWLGNIQQRLGEHEASLRTFLQAMNLAERENLLMHAQQLPKEARDRLDLAIATIYRARELVLDQALQPLREKYGVPALARIQRAVDRLTGKLRFEATHPLQKPTFLLVPGLPDLPWFDRSEFPFLDSIEQATDEIRAEMLAILGEDELSPYVDMPDRAPAAPIWRELNRSLRWGAYHLYRHGQRIEKHAQRCPRTMAAIEALPLHRVPGHGPEALFSVLRPDTHIPPHTGVINGRLTVHLPLIVPENCGALAVARQPRPWQEGHCLIFDDSFVHEAINTSPNTRVVLIFDIWNPHLSLAERDALATAIAALGDFNRRNGAGNPMQEIS